MLCLLPGDGEMWQGARLQASASTSASSRASATPSQLPPDAAPARSKYRICTCMPQLTLHDHCRYNTTALLPASGIGWRYSRTLNTHSPGPRQQVAPQRDTMMCSKPSWLGMTIATKQLRLISVTTSGHAANQWVAALWRRQVRGANNAQCL